MDSATSLAAPAAAERPPARLSHLGDELLARQAARGSERAFTIIYQRYHQPLYRYCRSILRHDQDAQDALQSTFTGALAALRQQRRTAPLRPWLYRIAHNEAVSLLRRRGREGQPEPLSEQVALTGSVEQAVDGRARWRGLIEDLSRLPERQRSALLLRELSGLSHEEIGIALGTTTAAAKQAIFEARQGLAEIEEGREMSCEEVRRRISDGDRRVLRGRRLRAHLRACPACELFAASIPARREQLRALTPALPSAAAAAVLAGALRGAPSRGGWGAGGTSAATSAGAAGKATTGAFLWKALASVAMVAGAAAGVRDIRHVVAPRRAARVPALSQGAAERGHPGTAAGAGVHRALGRTLSARAESSAAALPPAGARSHRRLIAGRGHGRWMSGGLTGAGSGAGRAGASAGGQAGTGSGQPAHGRPAAAGGAEAPGRAGRSSAGTAHGGSGASRNGGNSTHASAGRGEGSGGGGASGRGRGTAQRRSPTFIGQAEGLAKGLTSAASLRGASVGMPRPSR